VSSSSRSTPSKAAASVAGALRSACTAGSASSGRGGGRAPAPRRPALRGRRRLGGRRGPSLRARRSCRHLNARGSGDPPPRARAGADVLGPAAGEHEAVRAQQRPRQAAAAPADGAVGAGIADRQGPRSLAKPASRARKLRRVARHINRGGHMVHIIAERRPQPPGERRSSRRSESGGDRVEPTVQSGNTIKYKRNIERARYPAWSRN
jgi:hypothetical protein